MSLDPKFIEAVKNAAAEYRQPPTLVQRLIAWLEAVADESEDINDTATTDRHLEIIYEAVLLSSDLREDEATGDDSEDDD